MAGEDDEAPPTDLDRLISALSDIAYQIERLADTMDSVWDRLDDITPETRQGVRYLRNMDFGRD
jgi:hypothetical protein